MRTPTSPPPAARQVYARRLQADFGRQWLGKLEHGEPSLDAAMVLGKLETLGLEIALTPYDPVLPWIVAARRN